MNQQNTNDPSDINSATVPNEQTGATEPATDNYKTGQTETDTCPIDDPECDTASTNEKAPSAEVDDTFSQTAMPKSGDTIATVKTNMGSFSIRLFPDIVPKTVENFATHARNGYYDGIIFHRVIDGFMIQGGDPQGNGTGGESIWGEKFDDEFDERLSNIPGSIAMANAGPNTNGSQFFINQVDNSFLDFNKQPFTSKHAVFGQVFEGMDVVDAITKVEKNAMDKPLDDVVIETITISEF